MEWSEIYTPKPHIQDDWFNSINDSITLMKVQDTISTLPNNKASGPSSITYEDIKHLDAHTKQFLVEFFNLILTHHTYPSEWNKALLFPIPKPKDWNCQINNTRPIVLLETTQKLLVKILTTRLNIILSMHPILEHNNQAGLLGRSTIEPIIHIKHIIEHFNLTNDKNYRLVFKTSLKLTIV
ncbi:hypothetical protein C1645_872567 [Glomus cerebriforme]|uniref:Reverse transcriptase domain-containing protein n=1 Tax=Glomus cerebriforme TaxID=658196 RepID=A0A397TBT1_9GLOM|nr:hypothetical protein C1645_872567 [Glomus cerebriforme]